MTHEPVGTDGREQPVRFRGGGFAPRRIWFLPPLTFAGLLSAWYASAALYGPSFAIPAPWEVLAAFRALALQGTLATHAFASMQRLAYGWLLGVSSGVAIGFVIGLSAMARSTALPVVLAAFPVPKLALLPLFIAWFGIGETAKIATIALGILPPMVVATYSGIDSVDRSLIRMAQSFEVPTASILRRIILPGAMPGILSGVQIATSIGILLLVAAEMIAADYGIGAFLVRAANLMRMDQLMVGVLLLAALGLMASLLIASAKRWLLRWH